MLDTAREERSPLLGRSEEQQLLESLLDDVLTRGRALVVRGEPGIGKSRLLEETAHGARERGMTVLTTMGVQSEAHLPFAGLHQLLRPVRARARELRDVQRAALDAAFGLTDEAAPEHFRIAMAVLDLLSDVATDAALLLVVDDAQWLDRPTSNVLPFVARRIESDPILLLAATRDGYPSVLGAAGVPEHRLTGLDDRTASILLDASAPGLSVARRARVLREAAGNPLAILELPAAVGDEEEHGISGGTPLTERLERAFAGRVSELPDASRLLVLVAALSDGDRLDEILEAGSLVSPTVLDLDAAGPAVNAGILDVDLRTVRFRHPLIRSAVAQSAGLAERRRVHEALAKVLEDQPDRRAWHRAALVAGEREDIARELEEAATRARRRGATPVAVTAMRRAAELGEPASTSRRLLAAAGLAVELGQADVVVPLLREIGHLDLTELDRARATLIEETALTRPLDGERLQSLLETAERVEAGGDHDLYVELLWLVASRAWWREPGPDVRRRIIEAASRLGDANAEDPRVFAVHAYADPLGHAEGVLARLRTAASDGRTDTDAALFYGPAALVVGAFDLGIDFLAAAVDGLRTEGRLGHFPRLLTLHSRLAARTGDLDEAITAAGEASRIAAELGEPQWRAAADTVVSLVAAMRGDHRKAELLAAQAESVAGSVGANITVAFAQSGKVLAALATGRHADAYRFADRLFDPADPAYHPVISSWSIADLAEAARNIERVDDARGRLAQVEADAGDRSGTWVDLGLGQARALLADPAEAGDRFDEALAVDLTRWPFDRARIQLAYGQWLRRQRRVAESRAVLRTARDTFDALGTAPWSDQARSELRASGERSRRRVPEARDQLTAQELQIAQLAAQGLSNREIGQRLFLSHRTISTHLYRVFPKLGITSRTELSGALAPAASSH
jgi:DNA-binding CsgD family transcriptional regulator